MYENSQINKWTLLLLIATFSEFISPGLTLNDELQKNSQNPQRTTRKINHTKWNVRVQPSRLYRMVNLRWSATGRALHTWGHGDGRRPHQGSTDERRAGYHLSHGGHYGAPHRHGDGGAGDAHREALHHGRLLAHGLRLFLVVGGGLLRRRHCCRQLKRDNDQYIRADCTTSA